VSVVTDEDPLGCHRSTIFRRVVATVCVGLSVMLSGQGYISLKDRAEHAHHHAHFANPMAGAVTSCHEDVCGHRDDHGTAVHHHHDDAIQDTAHHDHGGAQDVADHDSDGINAAAHHHGSDGPGHEHGDATIVFLTAKIFVLPPCGPSSDRCMSAPSKFVSISPRGPDHPPKLNLELKV
jgi:hypothetical protein